MTEIGSTSRQTRQDAYGWRPLWVSLLLMAFVWAMFVEVNFVPLQTGPTFRDIVGMFLPVPLLVMVLWGAALMIWAIVASLRFRLRRVASLACAILIMPLFVWALPRLTLFSPHYWYVLFNQSSLEREAKTHAASGYPAKVVLVSKDISFGLVTNPSTFISIVYDETDELGGGFADKKLPAAQNGTPLYEGASSIEVRHLHGHFYLITATY